MQCVQYTRLRSALTDISNCAHEIGGMKEAQEDLVAFGMLVSLLTEFPQKQKGLFAMMSAKRSEVLISHPKDEAEQLLADTRGDLWMQSIKAVAPALYNKISTEVMKSMKKRKYVMPISYCDAILAIYSL